MNPNITEIDGVKVVRIAGELTGETSPHVQECILKAATPGGKLILDFAQVTFMSTAGFRLLLIVHRTIVGSGGKVFLVGLPGSIQDNLVATGFLDLYPHRETTEAAVAALGEI